MAFKFEKLRVWQQGIDLSGKVHEMTRTFPKEEMYVLRAQMMRAADSVPLNIAEGCTGQSNAEFKRFLGYANRSALEVISCLYLAKRRELINSNQFQELYTEIERLTISLQGLKKALR